jgi:hypothetical protein
MNRARAMAKHTSAPSTCTGIHGSQLLLSKHIAPLHEHSLCIQHASCATQNRVRIPRGEEREERVPVCTSEVQFDGLPIKGKLYIETTEIRPFPQLLVILFVIPKRVRETDEEGTGRLDSLCNLRTRQLSLRNMSLLLSFRQSLLKIMPLVPSPPSHPIAHNLPRLFSLHPQALGPDKMVDAHVEFHDWDGSCFDCGIKI